MCAGSAALLFFPFLGQSVCIRFSDPRKIASKTAPRCILEASKILFQASWAHLGPPGGAKIAIWLRRNARFQIRTFWSSSAAEKALGGAPEAPGRPGRPIWTHLGGVKRGLLGPKRRGGVKGKLAHHKFHTWRAQVGPKMAQVGPRLAPKWPPDGPKMAPRWPDFHRRRCGIMMRLRG